MPSHDFRAPRLFIDAPLAQDARVPLDRDQGNYLGNVLRLAAGAEVLAFNGLVILQQTRPQDALADLTYVFAPLKHARLDYMVQKAIEMGAATLQPVLTRFTQASRVNTERMRANVVEAAEQCGILSIAAVAEPVPLDRYLSQRPADRLLIFCDEAAEVQDPVQSLQGAREAGHDQGGIGIDVLIGPEGGFAEEERALLLRQPKILRLALGPRIMRADTAAVAALALVQAVLGDWGGGRG